MITIYFTFMLLQTAPATMPAVPTSQPSLDLRRNVEQEKLRQSMHTLPALPPRTVGETLSLSLSSPEGLIIAESPISSTQGAHRVDLTDLPGLAQINVGTSGAAGDRWADFQHVDFITRDAVSTLLQIFVREDYMMLAYDFTGIKEEMRVQLIQSPRMAESPDEVLRLYVERYEAVTEDLVGKLNLKADRFETLLQNHREETLRYVVGPIASRRMHRSLLRTPAGDAWQVLGKSVPLPESSVRKVSELVAKLNADEFADREAAAAELKALGAVGVMALATLDQKVFSEEQRQAIETIRASYTRLTDEQLATKQNDPIFLIGVLYSDELPLWSAALKQLKRDESIADDAMAVRAAGDAVLLKLIADSSPSTQPAPR